MPYLPHQAEYGEVIDDIREQTGREIQFHSYEWWTGYYAYITGRQDERKQVNSELQSKVLEGLEGQIQ